jgi:hypothetical protein
MSDRPRRPILSLKGVRPPPIPAAPVPARSWKCRPCGARLDDVLKGAADAVVRGPACKAKLGRMEDFVDESPKPGFRARLA